MGASFQRLESELAFGDDVVDLRMDSVAAGFEWRPGGRFSLQVGAGALVGGRLRVHRMAHEVEPGWIASVSASWTVLTESASVPFLSTSISLGASGATTTRAGAEDVGFFALDARASLIVGKTLWKVWVPYLVTRAFGGPVRWEIDGNETTGADRHHYQVGIGSVATCPKGFDVVVEWVPFGARGLTAGAGFAF